MFFAAQLPSVPPPLPSLTKSIQAVRFDCTVKTADGKQQSLVGMFGPIDASAARPVSVPRPSLELTIDEGNRFKGHVLRTYYSGYDGGKYSFDASNGDLSYAVGMQLFYPALPGALEVRTYAKGRTIEPEYGECRVLP